MKFWATDLTTISCHDISLLLSNSKYPDPDPEDSDRVLDKTRKLGLVVVRGTQVSLVSPEDGLEPIANPFVAQE